MDRYPHPELDGAVALLPSQYKKAPVREGLNGINKLGLITGYSYSTLLNHLIYIQPWDAALATNHVLRINTKQRLDIGEERFESLKMKVRDQYNLIPGPRNHARPEHLIVLPSAKYIQAQLVNFQTVAAILGNYKDVTRIKPHPDTPADILSTLELHFPGKLLPKEDALYPYVRSSKKLWTTTQSEAGVAAIFFNKPVEYIDSADYKGPSPALRTLYTGIHQSPLRISFREKMIRTLSYPESGLIPVGTGTEDADIKRFFTQYVLHRHAGE